MGMESSWKRKGFSGDCMSDWVPLICAHDESLRLFGRVDGSVAGLQWRGCRIYRVTAYSLHVVGLRSTCFAGLF